jgi:hypothetical protein
MSIRSKIAIKETDAKKAYLLPSEVIEKNIKTSICQTRVNEGIFINKSLYQLRKFIGDTIQKVKPANAVAPFTDVCAPLQCNPYYRDCFGQNKYYDEFEPRFQVKPPGEYGLLSDYIMRVDNSENITFCIINVVNLSKDANNPPPSPYIDITDLQVEYEKLLPFVPSTLSGKGIKEKMLGMADRNPTPSPSVVQAVTRLRDNYLVSYMPREVLERINNLIALVLANKGTLQENLKTIIEVMTNFNAITAIGTLEFTDMMAKYAINRVVCNVRPPTRSPPPIVVPQIVVVEEEKKESPPVPQSPRSKSPPGTPIVAQKPKTEVGAVKPTTRTQTGVISKKKYGK